MINVYIGKFNKKINSTARPTIPTEGTADMPVFICEIKNGTSILNPTLLISYARLETLFNDGTSDTIRDINYCYIPRWNRYYFITNIRFNNPNVEIDCQCDVLATAKTSIGNSSQYVARCASSAYTDGSLIDTAYPTKTTITSDKCLISRTPFEYYQNSRCWYSIGIMSQGGTEFYLVNYTTLYDIIRYLLTDGFASASLTTLGITLLGSEQAKLLVDPLQYISAIYVIPYDPINTEMEPLSLESVDTVPIGYAAYTRPSNMTVYRVVKPLLQRTFDINTSTFPSHPQASARGTYLNRAPYSTAQLTLPAYGIINVDLNEIISYDVFRVKYIIDMRTGGGTITLSAPRTGSDDIIFNRTTCNFLVPVPLSQVQARGIGALDVANAVTNVFDNISLTRPFSSVTSAFSSLTNFVGDAVKNSIPRVRNVGSYGSFADLYTDVALYFEFVPVVDADPVNKGAPCCKVLTINSLSGFVQCLNAHLSINYMTKTEIQQVINYLNGGFYYE